MQSHATGKAAAGADRRAEAAARGRLRLASLVRSQSEWLRAAAPGWRKERGLRQIDACTVLGLPPDQALISDWERGKGSPRLERIVRLLAIIQDDSRENHDQTRLRFRRSILSDAESNPPSRHPAGWVLGAGAVAQRLRDPFAYLRDVLTRLPAMTTSQIKEMTPEAWARAQRRKCKAAA